jgi:hypothetical protein
MPMVRVPRLTIGIPTYDRPLLVGQAIGSALEQYEPALVLVADQTGRAAEAVRPFLSNPFVRYLRTDATSLWGNWTAAAEACDTEMFCWLQDDDLVNPCHAQRVAQAFDLFPNARLYLGRLAISTIDGLANWWQGAGPMVPMNLRRGCPSLVNGRLITAGGYFSSFALSPGMAFRCDGEAWAAIRRCPSEGCDLYNERIVIAELASRADVICDPATVGSWVQHEGNESKRQVRAGGRTDQYPVLVERLDALLANLPGWEDALKGWCVMVGPGVLEHWLKEAEEYTVESPTYQRALEIVKETKALWRDLAPAAPSRQIVPETTVARQVKRAEKAVRRR